MKFGKFGNGDGGTASAGMFCPKWKISGTRISAENSPPAQMIAEKRSPVM
jgi:hypothetical protein